jgi:SAM-dependent methyltransferase
MQVRVLPGPPESSPALLLVGIHLDHVIRPAKHLSQCQKPSGWIGRFIVWNMNSRHSRLTDWGLSQIEVKRQNKVLDVGCGGGKTVNKLAALAREGKVFGIDYSDVSVSVAKKLNAHSIEQGRVEIHEASVLELPFDEDAFDLVTAVETHFWWPDLLAGLREIFRVLKPGGTLILIAEIYKGAKTKTAQLAEKYIPLIGMKLLTPDEHRALLTEVGYMNIQIVTEEKRGWICAVGRKPSSKEQAVARS